MVQTNPFESFPSRAYLEKYYSYVGDENGAMLRALADFGRRFEPRFDRFVEVGGGPSIVPILALCAALDRSPGSMTFMDISQKNLDEAALWLDHDAVAFDYTAVLSWLEGEHRVAMSDIERLAMSTTWSFPVVDLRKPLADWMTQSFDTISSHFFAESATSDYETFITFLKRIADLGAPEATVFLSFMRRSQGYSVAGIDFPAVWVDEETLPDLLATAGLHLLDAQYVTTNAEIPPTRPGYDGMVFVGGVLSNVAAAATQQRKQAVAAR